MYQLIISTAKITKINISQQEAKANVERIFQQDQDNNGLLDFEEFKAAYMQNPEMLSPFWTSS